MTSASESERQEIDVIELVDDEPEPISTKDLQTATLELFKLKSAEAAALQGHVIRTGVLYFAVMGALFKFAYDQNSTRQLRSALAVVGLATSAVFLAAALFGFWYRARLLETFSVLHERLGLQSTPEMLPGIKYSVVLALLIACVVVFTWSYVLVNG